MKTINLAEEKLDLQALIKLADKEPIMLLTPDGREFVLTEADDFDQEVETLRKSIAFQRFLEKRSRSSRSTSLSEIETEIDRELAGQPKST